MLRLIKVYIRIGDTFQLCKTYTYDRINLELLTYAEKIVSIDTDSKKAFTLVLEIIAQNSFTAQSISDTILIASRQTEVGSFDATLHDGGYSETQTYGRLTFLCKR